MGTSHFDTRFREACRLHRAGDLTRARELYTQLLAQRPTDPDTLYLLGALHSQEGRHDEAIRLLEQALALRPNSADAHASLGEALLTQRRLPEAIASLEQGLQLNPQQPASWLNLGRAWRASGNLAKAQDCLLECLELKPDLPQAHFNLANIHRQLGHLDDAIASYQRAITLQPAYIEALSNLGYTLKAAGRLDDSLAAFRRALALRPDHAAIHSGIVYLMLFSPDHDATTIYREHLAWATRHADPLGHNLAPHTNDRTPTRRLRIGYISPDFRDHCQSFFTIPLLSHHDHTQFEIICYSGAGQAADTITDRIRTCADLWRDTATLTDAQLADLIRADRIDILIDLTMHMAGGRLLTFARKPAPIQITWLAYPGTTGLRSMDYRFSDPHLDPPGTDNLYSETTHRLPDTFWCYDPLTTEPSVNPLPALSRGKITFGCLNNFCKVNDAVLHLWSQTLHAVPHSRLLILAPQGAHRQRTADFFLSRAIARDRIEFITPLPRPDYLALYHRIDIALDTFPYNGHTTSLDAFWMGIPVITLVGNTIVGRAGYAQLTHLGLPECIAHTPQEYIAAATALALDLPRLAQLRATLRQRLTASPLMDAPRFARNIESAYRSLWQQWCANAPPASIQP